MLLHFTPLSGDDFVYEADVVLVQTLKNLKVALSQVRKVPWTLIMLLVVDEQTGAEKELRDNEKEVGDHREFRFIVRRTLEFEDIRNCPPEFVDNLGLDACREYVYQKEYMRYPDFQGNAVLGLNTVPEDEVEDGSSDEELEKQTGIESAVAVAKARGSAEAGVEWYIK